MLRKILAVLGGFFVGVTVVRQVQKYIRSEYPTPDDLSLGDTASFEAFVSSLPLEVFQWIIMSHAVGALVTGFVAARIASDTKLFIGGISLFVFLTFAVFTTIVVPHPQWLRLTDPLLILVCGYVGIRLGCWKR